MVDVVREGGVDYALLVVGVGVHDSDDLDVRLGEVEPLRAGQPHGVQAASELLLRHAPAPQGVEILRRSTIKSYPYAFSLQGRRSGLQHSGVETVAYLALEMGQSRPQSPRRRCDEAVDA